MNLEIESQDVIRLMLQFLKENNMTESLQALQAESGVSLNTVDNADNFTSDILHGKWDKVLNNISLHRLPMEKMIELHRQILYELLEARENDTAKELLRSSTYLSILSTEFPDEYLKLEHMCSKLHFDPKNVYDPGITKEKRRQEIADMLSSEIIIVPPSRLLTIIGQALRFQQSHGILPPGEAIDIFRGSKRAAVADVEEKIPRKQAGVIRFNPESHPETVSFSPDGQSLLTGSIDGFLEVWDVDTCKLRKDLEYQTKDEFMLHEDPILCSSFNKDGQLIATGSRDGMVKIWKLSTGVCLRKIPKAHNMGVTCVSFAKDSSQIITGSFDCMAKIHGLKTGKTLKEFRGHSSIVNTAIFTKDGSTALTGSSDGSIRLWDVRTCEGLLNFRPGHFSTAFSREVSIISIQLHPLNLDHVIVCTKDSRAYLMTTHGQLIRTYSSGKATGGDFTCCAVSPQGKWIYCVGEDGTLYVFDSQSSELENVLQISEREVIGIAHHPQRNLVVTITDNGELKVWKP